ncbi:DUF4907 domain-containing protein [Fulvivirgaceae bacterium BMA10]|uniref:DUF4907 domain-containing protein n=1 Tax=Splendidivirga corallicola TaxID=3051826 RepID=A0ABT8KQV1_9BACT|nr:DUF4907 domain-containing protein [Fulvivirgaceae bacterium BMA10]
MSILSKRTCFLIVLSILIFGCGTGESSENLKEEKVATDDQSIDVNDKALTTQVKTYVTDNGWGYRIEVNGQTYISQPHIPTITIKRGFSSKEKALKVGEFVAAKIRNNIIPPSVTKQELDSLEVLD